MSSISRIHSRFTKKEAQAFFDKARQLYRGKHITILYTPASKEFGRMMVITSRVVGNAPERNTVRRRVRALCKELSVLTLGYDFAIIAKKPVTALSFSQLKEIMQSAFKPLMK